MTQQAVNRYLQSSLLIVISAFWLSVRFTPNIHFCRIWQVGEKKNKKVDKQAICPNGYNYKIMLR